MGRELCATIGSTEVTVTVEATESSNWRVVIDGAEREVDALRVAPGLWSLLIDGRSYLVDVDERASGIVILSRGLETPVTVEDARRKQLAAAVGATSGAAHGETIVAPIAGRVVKLLVEGGTEVTAGQGVIVLEAMKMENEIKADRGGRVEAIHVEAGQSVETREKLITLS